MDPHEPSPYEQSDISPAIPLEISADLAAGVDAILQDFAEGAELETALVVERSGALVSGISSEAEVMVEIISALVAGASAAMNSLVKELGSTGNIESFHQSEERAVYLAEVMDRFVLVGVSTVPVPVGVIREKARQVRPALIDLLQGIPVTVPVAESHAKTFSLREMAAARLAERGAQKGIETVSHPEDELLSLPLEEEMEPVGKVPSEEAPEMIFEADETDEAVGEPEPVMEEAVTAEPTEVIERLDDGAPEIVIEDSSGTIIDSPFETEDDDDDSFEMEDSGALSESIFELEDEEEDSLAAPVGDLEAEPEEEDPSAVMEIANKTEAIFEIDDDESPDPETVSSPVFEIEEESSADDDDDEESSAFELDFDDFEEDVEEETAGHDSIAIGEEEEEETSNSGPFYF